MRTPYALRICIGANHQPDCHHQAYMRHGVEAFLASARTQGALTLAIANLPHPGISPSDDADAILRELAGVVEEIDPYRAVRSTDHAERF